MKLFKNLLNRVEATATQKVTDVAENLVSQGIDQTAALAAGELGRHFGKPVSLNQQVIDSYKTQITAPVVETNSQTTQQTIQQMVQQAVQQERANRQVSDYFQYPDFERLQLGFEPLPVNKLDDDKVKRLADYKTNMFFQVNNIGKNAIRFLGQKFFSYNLEQSKQIVEEFEAGRLDDVKAYKKAKYKLEKVAQLENMKDDAEQEKLFRDFVADVILDELKQKNERGELQMPSMMDIALQQFGLHAWAVFSPDLTLESYLGV